MKNVFKLALVAAMLMSVGVVSAQKMARVNVQAVVSQMPEMAKTQSDLEAYRNDLAANLETMQVELNNKVTDFQRNEATMNESIRNLKQKEMQDLNQRMVQFEQTAMQDIQRKQVELLEPVLKRAQDAIAEVAKAGSYVVVFDESGGALAYFDESQITDVTPAVRLKLGIVN
ncbi:MAG: OmpH family outer membrane protein [Rikenellaceae bacterium]